MHVDRYMWRARKYAWSSLLADNLYAKSMNDEPDKTPESEENAGE